MLTSDAGLCKMLWWYFMLYLSAGKPEKCSCLKKKKKKIRLVWSFCVVVVLKIKQKIRQRKGKNFTLQL